MSVIKFSLSAAIISVSSAAFACPCPDKPMPERVLAPQVADVAMMEPERPASQPVLSPPSPPEEPTEFIMPETESVDLTQMVQAETEMEDKTETTPENMTIDSKYEAILRSRISPGQDGVKLFDYAGVKAAGELDTIKDYITALEARDPDAMSETEALSYWANLYNAVTLRVVLENYPVKSIKKIGGGVFGGGPWKKDEVTVNGKALSLDDIEHGIMRKQYPSPYIHYMVNCASIGCPNLQPKLWTADSLKADQKKAASEFINTSRGVTIKGSDLKVSSIYHWYKEDFGGNNAGVLEHVKQYAKGDLKAAIDSGASISGHDYNWNLNE